MADNKVKDLAPLAKLTKLASLDLDGNEITDVGPLASVTRLSTLGLSRNQITDITPLAKQTETRYLFLDGNKIADLGPLVAAAKKDSEGEQRMAPFLNLYLEGNPLGDEAKTKQVEALKSYGVRVYFTRPKSS